MIAALPMYDRPETARANDRLWAATRDRLRADGLDAPEALTRGADPWAIWRAPELVLAQTCGLPFRAHLHPDVQLVGTPDYGLPGCPPGHYASVFVARSGEARRALPAFAGHPFAVNDGLSQSGWAAPVAHVPALARGPVVVTGGHRASARAVAEGRADLAALDAQSWRLIRRHDPFAAGLVEVARTAPSPGLPLICAPGQPAGAIARAVAAAIEALSAGDRATLDIAGFVTIPAADYITLPLPPPLPRA